MFLCFPLFAVACSGPADSDNLSIYTRNQSDGGYGFTVGSGWLLGGQQAWSRIDESTGCYGVQPGWQLSVGPAGPNGATGPYTFLFGDGELGPSPEVWIDVAPDGAVSWGQGQPAWAIDAAPDNCGSPQ